MEEIGEKIREILRADFDVDLEVEVTEAPVGQKVGEAQADFATNVAMKVAGAMKNRNISGEGNGDILSGAKANPRKIAEEIVSELRSDEDFSEQFKVEIAGPGFLNFIARDEYWKQGLESMGGAVFATSKTDVEIAEKEKNFAVEMRKRFLKNISCDEYSGKKVVCEFSDPNPFKVLHVGHLYTSIVGDAISKLVEFAGGKVVRANFGGDVGLHVAKTLYALLKSLAECSSANASIEITPEILAKCYVEGTRAYEEDEEAKAKITKLNKVVYEIAETGMEKKWEDEKAQLAELYWQGRKISYQYFEDFYARVGVKFDKYYPESSVAGRGLKEVKAQIGKVYKESNGAVVFEGEPYGLHTRVFINAEGLPTYETKDVGLLFTKWDDYHFDKSIVITGNDIIDYMKVVLKSVSLYAPELVERTMHVTHGNVRLPGNEKMSSRKGNFVKAVDVLNDVETLADGDTMIALGAIKYAFLKYKIGGNIEFDAKESVSTTGNSGVYLQYSAVRAAKILQKALLERSASSADALLGRRTLSTSPSGAPASSQNISTNAFCLNEYEKNLVRKLMMYKVVLAEAVRDLAPHKIATYLYETAQEFSRFYENVKVAGSEFEAERAGIVRVYLNVMTHGLMLLGIEVPEEM